MRKALAFLLILLIPVGAAAGIGPGDLPAGSTWYLHVDLEEMRDSDAGKGIHDWLDDEVIQEIDRETGINLYSELDRVTAYSAGEGGPVIVMEGNFSEDTKDKLMALAATAETFDQLGSRNQQYYFVKGDDTDDEVNVSIDGIDDAGYFSFAVDNKIIVTGTEAQMQDLLDNRGRIAGQGSHDDALFILTAERSFVQAGLDTDAMTDESGAFSFDSNVLQNTKHAALMLAERAGKIALEVELVTTDPEFADSVASIVRGLIALQIFSDEMDPEVAEVLRGVRVDVDDNNVNISVAMSPETFPAWIE